MCYGYAASFNELVVIAGLMEGGIVLQLDTTCQRQEEVDEYRCILR